MRRSALPPHALRRARVSTRERLRRVGDARLAIVQTAVAAALAWALARVLVGQPAPFFAPVAAVVTVGLARGAPLRRAVEIGLGVATGIALADLFVRLIGTGTLQIAVLLALTMTVALFVTPGILFVNQAGISAILVMTLPAASRGNPLDRLFDALIGGAVAVVLSQVLLSRDPVRAARDAAAPVVEALAGALRAIAVGLRTGRMTAAEAALARVRDLDADVDALYEDLATARGVVRWSPPRRHARARLEAYVAGARQLDYAVRNARVLGRAARTAVRRGVPVDGRLVDAIGTLAAAADALRRQLDEPHRAADAPRLALAAAREATAVVEDRHDLPTSTLVAQVRAIAFDVMRASGVEAEDATERLDATLPPADRSGADAADGAVVDGPTGAAGTVR
ncbi:FUSC family protein [Patulibacter sp. SYSU D01012]|uniref:FUSC family protein n=1 Tax=Patulibacter sp. SYSU D01012 TaxID=2817381 RepID=UPI001B3016A4|nr:FUSC family protein [Patulibacter sp. SYSU D01012]